MHTSDMAFDPYQAADLLLAIESEMRQAHLWEGNPPQPELLTSPTPFCFDTLSCTQWLQWIFIPKMKEIIESGQILPSACHIFPYAEDCFREDGIEAVKLLAYLQQFDDMCA